MSLLNFKLQHSVIWHKTKELNAILSEIMEQAEGQFSEWRA